MYQAAFLHPGEPVANYFDTGGVEYAAHRPTYPESLAAALAGLPRRRRCAVDVGCGTGQLSVLLAREFDSVIATDASGDQIAAASEHERVSYRCEPAEAIGMPDGAADLITVAQAAHWFDLPRFYAEATRIAADGAVIALVSYGVPAMRGSVGDRLHRLYWSEIHACWPPERRHVEVGYQSLPFPFEEIDLPEFQIRRDWTRDDLLGYVETWSATTVARSRGSEGVLRAFANDLDALWPDDVERQSITWTCSVRAAPVASGRGI